MIDVSGEAETRYYYHFDGLGSVIALSDENIDIVERYSYDIFGEPNTTSTIGNPYLFTARRFDPEAGLYYYRARYYAYDIGRFLQPDPIGYDDGMNMYAYVENNPVNWYDPYGEEAIVMARPLEGSIGQFAANRLYGKGDVRGQHYQIFYSDGSNSGYFKPKKKSRPPVFKSDKKENVMTYGNIIVSELDDKVLQLAEYRTQLKWQIEWLKGGRRYNHPTNDCQTYILEVLYEYNRIMHEQKTKVKK
jgi:RHS repeat-associated protein